MESHTIFAVGGHREVINYTKACNELLNLQICYGIIDGDLILEEDEIKKFKEKRIIVLAFNEIEMFLIEEKIVKAVIEYFEITNEKIEEKFEEYKEKIKKHCVEKNYEEILKWCSLKKEITKELANKELVRDYEKSALIVISKKENLQKELKEKYFKGLRET